MPYNPVMAALAQMPTYDPQRLNINPDEMFGPSAPADPMYQDDSQAGLRLGLMQGLAGQNQTPSEPFPGMPMGMLGAPGAMLPGGDIGNAPVPPEYLQRAQQVRQAYEPGPAQQRYMSALTGQPAALKGFGGHLMGALKGLAMGNIGGAVLGAIDPNMVNRAWYRTQAQAYQQPAQVEQQMQEQRLKSAGMLANATGIDPITGLESPLAAYRRQLAASGQGRLDEYRRRGDIMEQKAADAERKTAGIQRRLDFTAEVNNLFKPGASVTPEQLSTLRAKYPEKTIPDIDPTKYSLQVNADGTFTLIPISGPKVGQEKPVTGPSGKPVTSYEKTKEAGRERRQASSQAATAAQQAQQRAYDNAQKTAERAQKTWEDAVKAFDKAAGSLSTTPEREAELKAAAETARKVYETAQAGAAQATKPQARSVGKGAVRDPNIGKTVNGGKNTIVGIDSSGNYIFDPPLN